jgi:hypothetical protein
VLFADSVLINTDTRFAVEGIVATNVLVPLRVTLGMLVKMGYPVQYCKLPLPGVPNTGEIKVGLVSVGLVANTADPLPVSSVSAAARFALEGVVRNVVTPVPVPVTPLRGTLAATVALPTVTVAGDTDAHADPLDCRRLLAVPGATYAIGTTALMLSDVQISVSNESLRITL